MGEDRTQPAAGATFKAWTLRARGELLQGSEQEGEETRFARGCISLTTERKRGWTQ